MATSQKVVASTTRAVTKLAQSFMSGALTTAARRLGASSRPRATRGLASDASASTSASASDASSAAAWTVGDYARTGVALGLAVATAGVCESALNDLFVWSLCKRRAMPAIETHPRLRRSLGEPLRADAWWNASVTHRGRGNLASCVFLLDGSRASCDVQVVMARAPSRSEGIYAFASCAVPNLARNVASPEAWRVVRMEAILPHEREAGLPGRVNLLQEPEPKGGVLETQGRKGGKGGRTRGWSSRIGRWFGRGETIVDETSGGD